MHTSHNQSNQRSQPTIESGRVKSIIWRAPCYFQKIFTWHHGTFGKKRFQPCNSLVAKIHGLNFKKGFPSSCAVQVPLIVLHTDPRNSANQVFEPIVTEHAKSIFSWNAPAPTFAQPTGKQITKGFVFQATPQKLQTIGTLPGNPGKNRSRWMSVTPPRVWWKHAQQTVDNGQWG